MLWSVEPNFWLKNAMNYFTLSKKVRGFLAHQKTPFFLFDLNHICSKIDLLNAHIHPDKIFYALKSNSLLRILEAIASKSCGFEVNNAAELDKAIDLGVDPSQIINSSPKTSANDINTMYARGVKYFTFDSKDQIDNLKINAPGSKVVLRIFSTNEGSKFDLSKNIGAHPEFASGLLNYAKKCGLNLYGIMFHVGSQCHSPKNWRAGIKESAKLFKHYRELRVLNIGGGFPIEYNETIPGIEDISNVIKEAINESFIEKPIVYVEPGRYLVGDSALACTSVIQVINEPPISRVTVDISVFAGLIEIIEKGDGFQYTIKTAGHEDKKLYKIVGSTCAGTDVIANEIMLPRLSVNHKDPNKSSRLYISNTGAYTLDYISNGANYGFNGAKIPQAFFINNGELVT
jgi:ornithine decarboxylase